MSTERQDPPYAGTERELLLAHLEHQRATLLIKTGGLDSRQLAVTLPPSDLTLGGLLKHTASNEDYWFCHVFAGWSEAEPWASVDWEADQDWDWRLTQEDTPASLVRLWQQNAGRARAAVEETDLDAAARGRTRSGRQPTLRWIALHMLEEYARHNGHADLIRESIDGATGE